MMLVINVTDSAKYFAHNLSWHLEEVKNWLACGSCLEYATSALFVEAFLSLNMRN
jgi:hypothetical protein